MSVTTTRRVPETAGTRKPPTLPEMLMEVVPLVGVVVVAGPPVVLLAGPLVIGTLLLAGPFALLATLALVSSVVLVATVTLARVVRAIVAPLPRLVHRVLDLRGRTHRPGAAAGSLAAITSRHAAA